VSAERVRGDMAAVPAAEYAVELLKAAAGFETRRGSRRGGLAAADGATGGYRGYPRETAVAQLQAAVGGAR
jgi:hypothetical protein